MYNNAACILLHYLSYRLTMRMYGESKHADGYNYSYINQMIMMVKVVINFACVNYTQYAILGHYDPSSPNFNPKGSHTDLVIWLIYQLLMFYINIASQMLFLTVSRFTRFYTLRERAGFGGNKRYEMDFLDFVKEDFHWFSTIIIQIFLAFFAYFSRIHINMDITLSLICVVIMICIDLILCWYIFFSLKEIKKWVMISLLVLSAITNVCLSFTCIHLTVEFSNFWLSFVLQFIMCHFVAYFIIFINYKSFESYKEGWELDFWMRVEIKKIIN